MEEVLNEIPDANIELIPAECDLANLESIKSFVSTTLKEENSLDVVCYNAGIARNTAASECLRTKEGLFFPRYVLRVTIFSYKKKHK
eukprot:1838212-Ditylum_brightwellii.AAC.1